MKKIQNPWVLCFALFCLIQILQGCKKDSTPSPADKKAGSTANALIDSSVYAVKTIINSDSLTFSYGCTDNSGMIYAFSKSSRIYKITPQGRISVIKIFKESKLTLIAMKIAKNGDIVGLLDSDKFYRVFKITPAGVYSRAAIHTIKLYGPTDLALGADGTIFIADYSDGRIVKIAPDGKTSILAGKAGVYQTLDGKGDQAGFAGPQFIRYAEDGYLVVAEDGPFTLRKVTLDGTVSTIIKAPAGSQRFITGFAVAHRDKNMNIAPHENFFIQTMSFASGITTGIIHLSDKNVETQITANAPSDIVDGPGDVARVEGGPIVITGQTLYLLSGTTFRKVTKR